MTCPACTEAATNPRTHTYQSGCEECECRAMANGPDFAASRDKGYRTVRYRALLANLFGERQEQAHAKIKAWADRISTTKERT